MNPIHWYRETFRYYVVFTKSIVFILGLILSYKLVEKTFLNILITRLTSAWEVYDLRTSVVIVNLQEGSAVLVPVFAYVADVYTGRFLMVVLSTAICIVGLILNFLAAGNDDNGQFNLRLFYPALVLMALAQAARTATLQAFLDDQFRLRDVDANERRRHTKFWWALVSFVAVILAQLEPLTGFHFKKLALLLIIVMVVFFIVFLWGFKRSDDRNLTDPSYRNVEHPQAQERRVEESRAAKVRPVKLVSLWLCLLILSLVSACGRTFFFLEASRLADYKNLTAILILANLVRVTEFVVSEASSYTVRKLRERKRYNQQKMELLRIGIGMFCCVLCCIVAVWTATQGKYDTGDKMSVYWLIPQFFLLGLIGGLSKDGFQSLYESQASAESLSRYGASFKEFAKGVGSFMSIICIHIFRWRHFMWFRKYIDNSSLNKYYNFLAFLSVLNVMFYCMVAFGT